MVNPTIVEPPAEQDNTGPAETQINDKEWGSRLRCVERKRGRVLATMTDSEYTGETWEVGTSS